MQDYPDFDITVTAAEAESPAVSAAGAFWRPNPGRPRDRALHRPFRRQSKVDNLCEAVENANTT